MNILFSTSCLQRTYKFLDYKHTSRRTGKGRFEVPIFSKIVSGRGLITKKLPSKLALLFHCGSFGHQNLETGEGQCKLSIFFILRVDAKLNIFFPANCLRTTINVLDHRHSSVNTGKAPFQVQGYEFFMGLQF